MRHDESPAARAREASLGFSGDRHTASSSCGQAPLGLWLLDMRWRHGMSIPELPVASEAWQDGGRHENSSRQHRREGHAGP